MNWRFENTGFRSGVFNMEYDMALARALVDGTGYPTIRVYGWQPPALSLGWNQSRNEIDLVKVSEAGIGVVRRPTGGRAILHSEELTYSIVMRVKEKNVFAVYDEISRALVAGLKVLGAPAVIEKNQPNFPSLYRTKSAIACFSSTGRYEIKCQGKKLVGSAQRRYAAGKGEEVVLQHGSILLGPDHKRLVDFLFLDREGQDVEMRKELDEKTTHLSAVLDRDVEFEETAAAILQGFRNVWSIEPEVIPLMNEEQKVTI
ncbi:MAG: lipoate--protein ligase family protein [Ignavibacteriae bacterium]|nr:MAG: lipoate--protein ligase family protein [Ignavibacteriota bacterium]